MGKSGAASVKKQPTFLSNLIITPVVLEYLNVLQLSNILCVLSHYFS